MNIQANLPNEMVISHESFEHQTLLPWEPGVFTREKNKYYSYDLHTVPQFSAGPHKWFNTALRLSEVCDIEQIETPGAIIMLPWGQQICIRFSNIVREIAENLGYDEFSYPLLLPTQYLSPLSDLIDVDKSILKVNFNDQKIESSNFFLAPTGECPIYQHWHKTVKISDDLPIKMFQKTKYFRPITSSKRTGGSVFLSMEAGDIFEFHSCFRNSDDSAQESFKMMDIFKTIANKVGCPVLWSLRPSWTNRGNLYLWGYGGDALLPSRYAVQVACAYNQGNIFSKRFNVTFSQKSKKYFTFHSTAAISRRLVFASLLQSMRSDMSLCLHPNLSPIQVLFLVSSCNSEDKEALDNISNCLKQNEIRIKVISVKNTNHLKKEERNWYKRGIPLKILFFGREQNSHIKCIIKRNDTGYEVKSITVENLYDTIIMALKDLENGRTLFERKYQVLPSNSLDEAKLHLNNYKTISIPLTFNPQSVKSIDDIKKGEILGFYSGNSSKCIVTGERTTTHAYVSRRI